MSSPPVSPLPNRQVIAQALDDPTTAGDPSLNAPLELFPTPYDQSNGNISTSSPRTISAGASRKRDAPTPKQTGKRHDYTSSPLRSILNGAAAFVTQITQTQPQTVLQPPDVWRVHKGPSPTSVLDGLFSAVADDVNSPAPERRRRSHAGMIGFVPRSAILRFTREDWFDTTTVYTSAEIKKQIKHCRTKMMYNFAKTHNTDRRGDINGYGVIEDVADKWGPVTRSRVSPSNDWVVDTSAADVTTDDTRRLQLYPIEQLMTSRENTKLLILVKVTDEELFGSDVHLIASGQGTEEMVISGERFYRLRATVKDDRYNILARGEGLRYSQSAFEKDFYSRKGNFSVVFDETTRTRRFNWREVVEKSSSIKFFGPPLSMTRSFDGIFAGASSDNTLFHRFISFYKEFEGDVQSCLSLYNSYTSRRMNQLEIRMKREQNKATTVDKDLFRSPKVVEFLDRFDSEFSKGGEAVFTTWTEHAKPIVDTSVMKKYIDESKSVFGNLWTILCDLRGVRPKQEAEKVNNIPRTHSVFFQILGLIRMANRQKLQNFGMVQNVTNLSRGMRRSAEVANSYFGLTVSNRTRRRVFDRWTGNNQNDMANGNDLKSKQSKLLKTATALIICYDNYQQGLSLQHQNGEHCSAFFKGTHQCAHKVNQFTDTTFDAYFSELTHSDQPIPSPWGMPVTELLNLSDHTAVTNFYNGYADYVSLSTPEFEGHRVQSYIHLRDVANHLNALAC